jgi:hypothetical protein
MCLDYLQCMSGFGVKVLPAAEFVECRKMRKYHLRSKSLIIESLIR